eukprot:TRINITY_DN3061_c2_g1_i8.p1 TRINITY_DN3061_c2_g1~~TRINITY_DN3061_c2_g1_i8.p1  ORF type:complete len:240 (+),score=43.83 TRINITY_DN3061_c2_g1_i8:727-1446(+)
MIQAIKDWPVPSNVAQLQSFLGLCNFCRKHIRRFTHRALPLYELLEKDSDFVFGPAQLDSFNYLRNALCKNPVLQPHRPDWDIRVECDSSDFACGGVILQRNLYSGEYLRVAYCSRKLTKARREYPIREKELLSLVYIFQKFRHYLLTGAGFIAKTDHQSLATLLEGKKRLSPRLTRWASYLSEFPVKIEYQKGAHNLVADSLSRRSDLTMISYLSGSQRQRSSKEDRLCCYHYLLKDG